MSQAEVDRLKEEVALLQEQLKRARRWAADPEVTRMRDGPHHLGPAADALESHILATLERVESQEITLAAASQQITLNFEEYREIAGMPPARDK